MSSTTISPCDRYHKVSFVSNVILLTVVLGTTLKRYDKFFMGLKGIKRLECVFTTAVVSLIIPAGGLFEDFVKRLKNVTCFHG